MLGRSMLRRWLCPSGKDVSRSASSQEIKEEVVRRNSWRKRLNGLPKAESQPTLRKAKPKAPAIVSIASGKEYRPPLGESSVVARTPVEEAWNDGQAEQTQPPHWRLLTDEEDIQVLIEHASPMDRHREWELVFSTARDGFSLSTLLRNLGVEGKKSPCLTVVKDTSGNIFGCYTAERWDMRPPSKVYGRAGESFVFSLKPSRNVYHWSGTDSTAQVECLLLTLLPAPPSILTSLPVAWHRQITKTASRLAASHNLPFSSTGTLPAGRAASAPLLAPRACLILTTLASLKWSATAPLTPEVPSFACALACVMCVMCVCRSRCMASLVCTYY